MSVQLLVCQSTDTCEEAAERMREGNVGLLPVLEADQVVGVVTDRDLAIRHLRAANGPEPHKSVRQCMTARVISIDPGASLFEATRKMREHGVRRLLVFDENSLQGIIALDDIFLELGRFAGVALVIQHALGEYRGAARTPNSSAAL